MALIRACATEVQSCAGLAVDRWNFFLGCGG